MRIGVVVPTYNRQRLVLETLESVAAQTRPPERVVVVDDCSSDDTVARVRDWTEGRNGSTSWQVHQREANGGVAAARNTGMTLTQDCDLLAFLDSDDLWPPDLLDKVAAMAERRTDAAGYIVDRLIEDSTRDRPPWMQHFKWVEHKPIEGAIRLGCPGPSCWVVRREALERAGGWNESLRYMEDFDALARLALTGPLAHVSDVHIRYRLGIGQQHGEQHSTSHTLTDGGLQRAAAIEQFKTKSGYPGLRRERAFAWYRAGRTAYRRRKWIECEKRCARSLRLAPWYVRPACLWLRARTMRLFGAKPSVA